MRRILLVALLGTALFGCTVGEDCSDVVVPEATVESELGTATVARCELSACVTLHHGFDLALVFRLPDEPGTFRLSDLDAETCEGPPPGECAPVTGTIVVREVRSPASGRPVGRLDADLEVTSGALQGAGRVDYREKTSEVCHDVRWPDIGGFPIGPR